MGEQSHTAGGATKGRRGGQEGQGGKKLQRQKHERRGGVLADFGGKKLHQTHAEGGDKISRRE